MSDRELVELLRKNPDKGLEEMMTLYMGLVYAIVKNKIALYYSKEDIEECVIDVFHEMYKQRHALDSSKGSIKGFIAVIAKRKAISLYRSVENKKGMTVSLEEDYSEPLGPAQIAAEQIMMEKEQTKEIIDFIRSLGEPDSEILIRKYYFGQSTRSIAQDLGIRENTIDKKISRGRNKLRELLGGSRNG